MKRVMITEAECLRDAFKTRDAPWIRTMMLQFTSAEPENCGRRGWLWKLSDGSDLILSDDNALIAAPRLRHL